MHIYPLSKINNLKKTLLNLFVSCFVCGMCMLASFPVSFENILCVLLYLNISLTFLRKEIQHSMPIESRKFKKDTMLSNLESMVPFTKCIRWNQLHLL